MKLNFKKAGKSVVNGLAITVEYGMIGTSYGLEVASRAIGSMADGADSVGAKCNVVRTGNDYKTVKSEKTASRNAQLDNVASSIDDKFSAMFTKMDDMKSDVKQRVVARRQSSMI